MDACSWLLTKRNSFVGYGDTSAEASEDAYNKAEAALLRDGGELVRWWQSAPEKIDAGTWGARVYYEWTVEVEPLA